MNIQLNLEMFKILVILCEIFENSSVATLIPASDAFVLVSIFPLYSTLVRANEPRIIGSSIGRESRGRLRSKFGGIYVLKIL